MSLTREEKKELSDKIEDFVTNALGPIEGEDLEEAGDFILKEIEDQLGFMVAFHQMTQ